MNQPNNLMKDFIRRGRHIAPVFLLAVAFAFSGACASDPNDPMADSIGAYSDFRNGWYHWATGTQTVREVAAIYQRDPALTAELNRTRPDLVPAQNTALYIPPVHDRALLRQILTHINANPSSVPTTPPTTSEFLSAEQMLAAITQPVPAVSAVPEPPTDAPPSPINPVAEPVPAAVQQPVESGPGNTAPVEPVAEESLAPVPVPTKVYSLEEAQKRHDAEVATAKSITIKAGQFNWPVQGNIIRPFSSGGTEAFNGIAIAAAEGTPILASREGRVAFAGELEGYGKVVILDHGSKLTSVYGYASKVLVKTNRQVAAGEQIALVGRPSATSPSQLFFQINKDAKPANPLEFVR